MAVTVSSLVVKLGLRDDDFKRGMARARATTSAFSKAVLRIGGAAAVGGALGLGRLVQQQNKAVDSTAKLASRLGTTTEFLSEMAFVAERSGVKVSGLNTGLQRMQRRIAEAAAGNKGLTATLSELGLEADALKGLSLEDQFNAVAKALDGIKDPADRTRLAFKLFDTEGVALLQTLEGGFEGIAAMRGEAQKLGVTIDKDAVTAAVNLNDAMTNLDAALAGIGNTLLVELGPALADFLAVVTDKLPGVITIFKEVFNIVGKALGAIVAVGVEVFKGNFSEGLAAARGFGSDLRGSTDAIGAAKRDLFGEKQVDEQRRTNDLLEQVVNKVGNNVAVAQ